MMRFAFAVFFLGLVISSQAMAKLNVFACEPEWKSLAEAVGGDYVKAFSATTALQDPHHIEARPSLISKVRRADLLICSGAELEIGWLPLLVRQAGNPAIQTHKPGYFMASDHVQRLDIPTELDRSQGDVHASGNPHVHLDPRRLLTIAQALSLRLQAIDPEHQDAYQVLLQTFSEQWQTAIARWESQAAPLNGKQAIVHHANWSYLFDWLNITAVADLEPKPGLPPTSKHLAQLLSVTKQQPVDFIVYAAYQPDKAANWLGQRSSIPVVELPFTVGADKQTPDLFTLMDNTLALLIKAIE